MCAVEAYAGSVGRTRTVRRAVVWSAIAVVALLALLVAALLWLRAYAPLAAWDEGAFNGGYGPGPGIVRIVDPATGSGGKTVYFADPGLHGSASAGFDIHNAGRFAVRLDGVVVGSPPRGGPSMAITGASLLRNPRVMSPTETRPFSPVTLEPDGYVHLVLRYATACSPDSLRLRGGNSSLAAIDTVTLRYTYLHVFHRTQTVEAPYAMTLQCGGTLPASTR
jgi:hypothetical protein